MNTPLFKELTTRIFDKKIIGTYFVSEQVMNYFFIAAHFSLEKTIKSFIMKMEMYPKDEKEILLKETIKETANKNIESNYIHRNSTERFYVKVTEYKECGEFNAFHLFQDFVLNLDDFNDAYKKNDFKPYNYYLKKTNDYHLQNNEIDIPELPEFTSIVTSVVNNLFLLFLKEVKLKEQSKEQPKLIKGFNTTLDETQIETLYIKLQKNYIECSLDDFKAIFTEHPKPIKWIDKGGTRHEPNKQTIFEFFYLLKENNYLKNPGIDLDLTGTNPNNFYKKLKFIFPNIKNFPNSNKFKAEQNTPRKKELKIIIQSL